MTDAFDTFERQVREALRSRRRRRRRAWAAGGVILALGGAATAAAVVVRDEPSRPLRAPLPQSGLNYQAAMRPDLSAGNIGWCVTIVIRKGRQAQSGGNGCGQAPSPERAIIGSAGMYRGTRGIAVTIVDERTASVRIGNRRIVPRTDPGIPAGWKVAVYTTTATDSGGEPPRPGQAPEPGARTPADQREPQLPIALDANGRELPSIDPPDSWPAGRHRYAVRAVDAEDPPDAPCAIRADGLPGLRAASADLLRRFPSTSPTVKTPAFLTCATTVYYLGRTRLRAAVLVDALNHTRRAAPLAENFQLSSRRVGPGWLVVFGGNATQRARLLRALTANL